MSRTKIWHVHGMRCAGCEQTIETILKQLPGVTEVEVSLVRKKAGIRFDDGVGEPDIVLISEELRTHGYMLEDEQRVMIGCAPKKKTEPLPRKIGKALLAILIVSLAYTVIFLPIQKYIPSLDATASLAGLLLFGIIASLSTCLASTGGFLLAYASRTQSKKRVLFVHIGRLIGFTIGGALLGAIGGIFPHTNTSFYGWFSLALGVIILLAGLHAFDLAPPLSSIGIRIPKSFSTFAHRVASSKHIVAPFFVGCVTFLLPCGFTQTAQALAIASGSPIRGALLMFAFALGTLPVLMGVSLVGSLATLKHAIVQLAVGAILTIFAIIQIDAGLTILGSSVTVHSTLSSLVPHIETAQPNENQGIQTIRMSVTSYGYEPSTFRIRSGTPVRWEIDAKELSGCSQTITIPSLHIEKGLQKGINIIEFTPSDTRGTIPFSCGMGMLRGTFIVE